MANLFYDGFNRYGAIGELARFWDAVAGSGISLETAGGPFGGGAILISDDDKYIEHDIPGHPQTCIVSFHVFRTSTTPGSDRVLFIDNDSAGELISLSTNGTGQIQVWRGHTVAAVLLGSFALPASSYQWMTMKVKASNTVGTIDIKVGKTNVFSFGPGNTVRSGSETCNNVRLGGDVLQDFKWGSVFIDDDAGVGPFNDLLPEMRIEHILPNAAGASAQFAATPAVANHLNVDDVAPDDDTTYVESSTLTDKDLHNLASLGITVADIEAVRVYALAKNPLGGGANLKLIAKTGTTEGVGASQALSSGYSYIDELYLTDPDTAVKWTEAGVNAMQAGFENA